MDTTQLLLIVTLGTMTVFSIVIGIQIILVLTELKKTLGSVNKIISGFEAVGMNIEHGFAEIVGFANGFKTLLKLFEVFGHKKDERSK